MFAYQDTALQRTLITPKTASQTIAAIIAGALTVTLSAQIRIELGFTPVPVTLQTLGVLLIGMTMGAKVGAGALMLYLAMGSAGAPVFAGWSGGFLVHGALTPNLGYLLAFPVASWMVGRMWESRTSNTYHYAWMVGLAGIAVIYLGGFGWLFAQRIPLVGFIPALQLAFVQGIVPFILVDVAKALVVTTIVMGSHRTLKRHNAGAIS